MFVNQYQLDISAFIFRSSMASITSSRSGRSTSDYVTTTVSTATPSLVSNSTHPASPSIDGSSSRTLQNLSRDSSRDPNP